MIKLTDEIMEQAEKKHYEFQNGCYFSDSKKIEGAVLLWNDRIKDSFWNYATRINVEEKQLQELIKKIIDFFKEKNRQPAIYVTPFTMPRNAADILKRFGFASKYKDSWMFYEKPEPKIMLPDNFSINEVKTKEEMKTFVDIFHQAYGGASPEEPYGALPKEYGECLLDSFVKPQKGKAIIHYLGFFDSKPVSIATLIYSGKLGCIYNVGTIPSYRGRGFGVAISLNAVADSIRNNAKIVFLQTEQGSFNENYYTNLGFSTKFICEGFVLE